VDEENDIQYTRWLWSTKPGLMRGGKSWERKDKDWNSVYLLPAFLSNEPQIFGFNRNGFLCGEKDGAARREKVDGGVVERMRKNKQ